MARKGVKPLEVSSGIGLNRSGMYRRLNCETPFTLDELLAIAAFLGVSASSFFPQEVTAQ